MSTILAWLFGIASREFLTWAKDQITTLMKNYEAKKASDLAAKEQAAQDAEKASKLNKDSAATEVNDAIDDEINHI